MDWNRGKVKEVKWIGGGGFVQNDIKDSIRGKCVFIIDVIFGSASLWI